MATKNKSVALPKVSEPFGLSYLAQAGILTVLFAILYAYSFQAKLHIGGDNFSYLILAKSIFNGHGYTSPLTAAHVPASNFPPGYSALLAFFMLFSQNVIFLKIINGLFFYGTIILLHQVLRKLNINKILAFVTVVLLLTNPILLKFSSIIMAEMPYVFFSVLSIWCLLHVKPEQQFLKSRFFWGMVLCMMASYYLRVVGIALLVAIVTYFIQRKAWKPAGVTMLSFVILYLPWIIRNNMAGIKNRYLGTVMKINPWHPDKGDISTYGEFAQKIWDNFIDTVIYAFPDVLFPMVEYDYAKTPGTFAFCVGIAVLCMVIWGLWNTGKFRYFFIVYLAANMGIVLLWHGGNDYRYVWPLTPIIAFGFFWGLLKVLDFMPKKPKQKYISYSLFALLLFSYGPLINLNEYAKEDYSGGYKNYFKLAEMARQNSPKKAVFACRKPAMFHYYSNRYCVRYKYTSNSRELIKDLAHKNVNYVVLEQLGYSATTSYLLPALEKNPSLFTNIVTLQKPNTYLVAFDLQTAKKLPW